MHNVLPYWLLVTLVCLQELVYCPILWQTNSFHTLTPYCFKTALRSFLILFFHQLLNFTSGLFLRHTVMQNMILCVIIIINIQGWAI